MSLSVSLWNASTPTHLLCASMFLGSVNVEYLPSDITSQGMVLH